MRVASLSFIDDISSIQSNDKMFNRSFNNPIIKDLTRKKSNEFADYMIGSPKPKSKFFENSNIGGMRMMLTHREIMDTS